MYTKWKRDLPGTYGYLWVGFVGEIGPGKVEHFGKL